MDSRAIISREGWSAVTVPMDNRDWLRLPISQVVLTQTAFPCSEKLDDCKENVRSIQKMHIEERQWLDIGYNFLVGNDGTIFEGRGWQLQGASLKGENNKSFGIAFMGRFGVRTNNKPSSNALNSAIWLVNYALSMDYLKESPKMIGYALNPDVLNDYRDHPQAPVKATYEIFPIKSTMNENQLDPADYLPSRLDHATARKQIIKLMDMRDKKQLTCQLDVHLGGGAYGQVYSVYVFAEQGGCYEKDFKHQVALKVLGSKLNRVDLDVSRLNLLMSLRHTNLVKHITFGESLAKNPQLCLLMEQCQGGMLKHLAEERQMFAAEVLSLISQVVAGLKYLHEHKPKPIMHGDLKGENILLTASQIVKIGDLDNFINLKGPITLTNEVKDAVGTKCHMSPEMLQKIAQKGVHVGKASDIWSVGCTILEMFNRGQVPYVDKKGHQLQFDLTVEQFAQVVAEGAHPDYSSAEFDKLIPPRFLKVIKKCLMRARKDRPSVAKLMKSLLKLV